VYSASIKRNEIADQLAKEAAKEAEALELTTQVFTKQDIRKTARANNVRHLPVGCSVRICRF
jgi:hypothetical protein